MVTCWIIVNYWLMESSSLKPVVTFQVLVSLSSRFSNRTLSFK
jgi:hypothetical protein